MRVLPGPGVNPATHPNRVCLSTKGAAFIGAWEGYRATAYDDSSGNATIGIGHLLHYGPCTAEDRLLRWSYQYALQMLQQDAISNGLAAIRVNVKVPLTQAQVDALTCFLFNTGPGGIAGVVGDAVNSKPKRWRLWAMRTWHGRVSSALLEWDHSGGVVVAGLERRRRSEGLLFATGLYRRPLNPYANA